MSHFNGLSVYTKCKQAALLAQAVYINSAHYCMGEPDIITKRNPSGNRSSGIKIADVLLMQIFPIPFFPFNRIAFILKTKKISKKCNYLPNRHLLGL